MGRRFKREGIYIDLWLIHVKVRQKTTKFCKAIILQLKNLTRDREKSRPSLVIQWLRICLLMQGTCIQSLVGETEIPHNTEQTCAPPTKT